MRWFDVVSIIIGLVGIAWGVRFYWELRKWAYLIKYGRVVIAFKGKVKINAPLEEWALWCKKANEEKDKNTNGRVIYHLGGTRVAVLRQSFVPDTPVVAWFKKLKTRLNPPTAKVNPQVQEGVWSAEDQTKKVA